MSADPDSSPPGTSLRLQTFGTLVLRGADGDTLWADYGQQGWRLALLAVLAAAGDRGCSRDRLLLLFWPDASQQQARHSLEQLLYKMRKSLPASPFLGVNPLRLDPAVLTSDVGEFERALAAGEPEAAVGHYRGPFLDGFYLGDSPEFEEWMTAERARLEGEYAKALEGLAGSAESRSDHAAAAGWWAKLCALDSLSGRNALGLMRALANSGDYPAALRHSEQYERRVAQELGTSAGPEIAALAAEIRARAQEEPSLAAGAVPGRPGILAPSPPGIQGGSREDDARAVPRPAVVPRRRGRPRRYLLPGAVALSLATVVFAATRLRDAPSEDTVAAPPVTAIAVLPLTSLGTDPADAALADGMTEELIAVLARQGDVRVIASTSVFALRDRALNVRQIADSLQVSHVVEGGLQKIGSRLRMQIRLVDAGDGTTRWSETYDREFVDVFSVQEEIARAVAAELGMRLAGEGVARRRAMPGRHTENVAAYEWYLRGMDNALMRTQEGTLRGIGYLQRAIAADSTYAAAYAGLSRFYLAQGPAGASDREAWVGRVEATARRAVALDDSLGQAHQALGWSHMQRRDFRAAEAEFRRAIALDPQVPFTHEGLAHIYLWTGRPAEQLAEARLALETDPYSHTAIREMARALFANGRCDEALERLAVLKELTPPSPVAGITGGQCYAHEGRWSEAIAEFRWAEEHSAPAAPAFLGFALARSGKRDEAEAILQDLLSGRRDSHGSFGIAVVYTGLRDYDQAFAWLDRAVDENSVTRDLMLPVLEDLHRDPRFERVKERLGLKD